MSWEKTEAVGITVGELLSTSHLGLFLVAGGDGLDREVTWAHVSELEDPAHWLEGGELVMTTGMGVPAEPERQRTYVARMDEAGIAALAISRDLLAPPLSDRMKVEADRRAFPILEVSIEVPFVAIAHAVAAATQGDAQQRLLTHLRIFDTLRAATSEGLEPRELFRRLEELSGCRLYLSTTSGRPLIDGVPAPPPELAREHLPRVPGQPPWIHSGYVISIPLGGRTAGYLFALEREGAGFAGLTAAQHIATVAALEVANRFREREVVRREGAETLAELLAGALDPRSAAKRLALAGFEPKGFVVLLAIAAPEGFDASGLLQAWGELGLPHLLLQQRELYALVRSEPEALHVIEAMGGLRGGASRPFHVDVGLAGARHEAHWALQRAMEGGQSLVRFPEDQANSAWLPADAAALRELVDRLLGPVLAYDEARGSALLRSLRVWLERDRRTESAAKHLRIHKHTLAYRLRRVEELTGKDLSRMQDVVDVWLALRALDVIGRDPAAAGSRTVSATEA